MIRVAGVGDVHLGPDAAGRLRPTLQGISEDADVLLLAGDLTEVLGERGIRVLEGQASVLDVDGYRLGVAGAKGFGGGFAGKSGSAFGEPEMKAFIEHTEQTARRLRGEPPEVFPFLGSYQLAEAVDGARGGTGVDLAVHGHAHSGVERGVTARGVQVRNVAQQVIRSSYAVYELPGAR